MLCSECSREVRPIAAFDIDGTLADYHDDFHEFAIEYWRGDPEVDLLPFRPWNGDGNFEDHIGLSRERYRETKLAYRQGGGKRRMPAFDQVVIPRIAHEIGFEVWLTTTRPWMRHDSTDPDTRHWLQRNWVYYDHILYEDPNKYERLAYLVDPMRVLFVIDDLPDMLRQAETWLPNAAITMMERSHNRQSLYIDRCTNNQDIIARLNACMETWRNSQ